MCERESERERECVRERVREREREIECVKERVRESEREREDVSDYHAYVFFFFSVHP